LLELLNWLETLTDNWGIAIVLVAVLVRIVTYPLAQRALKSQARFNKIQRQLKPALKEIKRNYKGGEQSERILALYQEHDTSPAAGMKPLLLVLLQLPIFIALFQILSHTAALHGAHFLWINDLAAPDRALRFDAHLPFFGNYLNVLPLTMAATVVLAAVIGQKSDEPGYSLRLAGSVAMAVVFFVVFYSFPSGLVLYWVTANLLHVVQQLALSF
jgi:YidC/Oxa1 family membrane protein insertase